MNSIRAINSQSAFFLYEITDLDRIPVPERELILLLARQLITFQMDVSEQLWLIRIIIAIPVAEREEVIRYVLQLLPEDDEEALTDQSEIAIRIQLIAVITHVPVNEREDVMGHAMQVITEHTEIEVRCSIIEVLERIPKSDRENVMQYVQQVLIDPMRSDAIAIIAGIPMSERADFMRHVQQVITAHTPARDRTCILKVLATIPLLERESVIRNAVELFVGPSTYCRAPILEAIVAVSVRDREIVIQYVKEVMHELLSVEVICDMIRTIAALPGREREDVIRYARQIWEPLHLAYEGAPIEGTGRRAVIRAIVEIPLDDRAHVIGCALQLIAPEMGGLLRARMIRTVAQVPVEQREHFVRRQPQQRNRCFDALQGVDVHTSNRDQRTKIAIRLLYRIQGPLAVATIQEAVDAFIAYIELSPMATAQKQLARDALLKPKQLQENFGPLLDKKGFTLLGLKLSGADLIGRFWIFASQLSDRERVNAQEGMIAALRDSYEGGVRVCNQGKIQRLVVAVLQGRLLGVNIEGNISIQAHIGQALEMFFHVQEHRNLQTFSALEDAANRFCDENPNVNREAFMSEIRVYAEQQEMITITESTYIVI